MAFGLFIQGIVLASLKSFGAHYLSPYAPYSGSKSDATYFVPPMWKREKRASFLDTKKEKSQEKISMKWKLWKGK